MKIASIDIGTNTILLLVADIDEDGAIHAIEHRQNVPRIGRGVDQNHYIVIETFDKIKNILIDYKKTASEYNVNSINVCATSAVRDATNKKDLIEYIKKETGLDIEILSGEEEAYCTFMGTVSGFTDLKSICVLDVGGGSTEISFMKNQKVITESFHIGALRLKERCFHHATPTTEEIAVARHTVNNLFNKINPGDYKDKILIGVAGTATTLACLDQQLKDFGPEKVDGYKLSKTNVYKWCQKLLSLEPHDVLSLSNITKGREDILSAGALILSEFMGKAGFSELIVSVRGLRYGLALREWKRLKKFTP